MSEGLALVMQLRLLDEMQMEVSAVVLRVVRDDRAMRCVQVERIAAVVE